MTGRILQVNISRGGVPKRPIPEGIVTLRGVDGDDWAHPKFHGGPKQAILLIAAEAIEQLIAGGFPLSPGALGENLTTVGLPASQLRIGQRFRAGTAVIELTKVRVPCETLSVYGSDIQAAVYDKDVKAGDPTSPRWALAGFYAAVVAPGIVRPGDEITLLDQAV
ncbi:MAG: MOSC domain-containing protein [Bryobacteraceae bacterium]